MLSVDDFARGAARVFDMHMLIRYKINIALHTLVIIGRPSDLFNNTDSKSSMVSRMNSSFWCDGSNENISKFNNRI